MQSPATYPQFVYWTKNSLVLHLLALASVVFLVATIVEDSGERWQEGTAALVAVAIVVVLTATVNYILDKQVRMIAQKDETRVTVLRGTEREISAEDLVVGDIMIVKEETIIPADGIVLEATNLVTRENFLTGNLFITKNGPLKDESNLSPFLLSGSKVEEGSGTMLVAAVGINCKIERVKAAQQDDSELSSIQVQLGAIAHWLKVSGGCVAVAIFLFLAGHCLHDAMVKGSWNRTNWRLLLEGFILAVIVLVVAVSDLLPLAFVLCLAYLTRKFKGENNLVRKVSVWETLGTVTDVVVDNAGTLTQDLVSVVRLYVSGKTYEGSDIATLGSSDISSLLVNSFCVKTMLR